MQVIVRVRLLTTTDQAHRLNAMMSQANAAANWLSLEAWRTRIYRYSDLHRRYYHELRERYRLGAQLTIHMISRVANVYRVNGHRLVTFNATDAIPYDRRMLTWYLDQRVVSMWVLDRREKLAFEATEEQLAALEQRVTFAELVTVGDEYYIRQACEVDDRRLEHADRLSLRHS